MIFVPRAAAEDDHGHIFRDRVYSTKGGRTPQHNHQAADVATVSLWLPRRDRDQCHDGCQLDAEHQHRGQRVVSIASSIADRYGAGEGNRQRGRPGSAATALVLNCRRSPTTRMSHATPRSTVAATCSSDVQGACPEISPSIRASHANSLALTAGSSNVEFRVDRLAAPMNFECHAGESITGDLMSKAW